MVTTTPVAGSGQTIQQDLADHDAEVANTFRAYLDMLIEDSRRGNVKVTDGKDPRRRQWVDPNQTGRRDNDAGGSQNGSNDLARQAVRTEPEQRADTAISDATQILKRLDILKGGQSDDPHKEITPLI